MIKSKPDLKGGRVQVRIDWLQYAGYFLCPFICLLALYCFETLGTIFPFLWLSYGILPLLDYLTPTDKNNRTAEQYEILERDRRYLVPLYLMFFITYYALFWSFNVIYHRSHQMSWFELVVFTASMASICSLGANVGHELQHRRDIMHQIAGFLLFLPMLNTAYVIVHSQNHHKYLGTSRDPSTAKKGEDIYSFAIKGMYKSLIVGYELESKRTQKYYPDRSEFFRLLHNQILVTNFLELLFLVFILAVWGWKVLLFFVVSAKIEHFFLEGSDYIEHYGLLRREIAPVSVRNSWDAAHRWTNGFIFKLQRHSDHHTHGYKPYQTLCLYDDSPQLPQGYTLMLLIMTMPSLYMAIMDPLVEAYQTEGRKPTSEELKRAERLTLIGLVFYVSIMSTGMLSYFI